MTPGNRTIREWTVPIDGGHHALRSAGTGRRIPAASRFGAVPSRSRDRRRPLIHRVPLRRAHGDHAGFGPPWWPHRHADGNIQPSRKRGAFGYERTVRSSLVRGFGHGQRLHRPQTSRAQLRLARWRATSASAGLGPSGSSGCTGASCTLPTCGWPPGPTASCFGTVAPTRGYVRPKPKGASSVGSWQHESATTDSLVEQSLEVE